jgi:hypothetical protein
VIEGLADFVPAADEVGRLQRGEDRECRFFQAFAEAGHYGGREEPSDTRQGIYMIAPSGRFLASVNTRRPQDLLRAMERALAAWRALPQDQRLLEDDPAAAGADLRRHEARFPERGACLRVTARDLARADAADDWRGAAWNEDWAWLRPEELVALCSPPRDAEPGATWSGPESLARRLARAQLVDFARGQTSPFRDEHVERAELTVTLEARDGDVLHLRLAGRSRTAQTGRWRVAGFEPGESEQTRGLELEWHGTAEWNATRAELQAFELVAWGPRWGGTQFNGRHDDLAPAPIGFVLELVQLEPAERVAPAHLWAYGW